MMTMHGSSNHLLPLSRWSVITFQADRGFFFWERLTGAAKDEWDEERSTQRKHEHEMDQPHQGEESSVCISG